MVAARIFVVAVPEMRCWPMRRRERPSMNDDSIPSVLKTLAFYVAVGAAVILAIAWAADRI
jgi:hypothetical protein